MAPSATRNYRPVVISGPSGSGKSTILKRLFADHPDIFGFSVSRTNLITPLKPKSSAHNGLDTTRSPRPGEQDGREYNFTNQAAFLTLVKDDGFIEHAQFGGNNYGTSVKAVKDVAEKGRLCVLDIEMEGVKQVKRADLGARFLFLSPPSLSILEERLRGRGTDDEDSVRKRLEQADKEMAFAREEGVHDKIVVNDDLHRAYREVEDWVVDGGRFGGQL